MDKELTRDDVPEMEPTTRRNPLERAPNMRLAKGYLPIAYWRSNGVEYALPTLADGSPDEETQKRGFYSSDAHRILRTCPHFKPIVEKGG